MEASIAEIKTFLSSPKTLAIVGASTKESKAGNYVPKFLQDRDFTIIPINPFADEILGEATIKDLDNLDTEVDGVIIYRNSEAATAEVKKAVDRGIEWIWLPEGVTSEIGKKYAEHRKFVQDKCPKALIEKWKKEGEWNQ